MGWRKRMERARRLHRPSLKDWTQDGLHDTFPAWVVDVEENQSNYSKFLLHPDRQSSEQVPVVLDGRSLSPEDFYAYETGSVPAVIQNIPEGGDGGQACRPWSAVKDWQLDALEDNSRLLSRTFKCGEDDNGKSIRIKLKHFLKYLHNNRDDSPLYIFDSAFDEDKYANQILRDYRVPSYFQDDLFGLVSESRRPPYRWWLVGPERSGTCVHIDPLATSAWNTLIQGKKRWVLFPPSLAKDIVKGRGLIRDDEDDEAIHYFMYILPRIKRKAASMKHDDRWKDFRCYEFTQNAGETVFVPNGWWHAVLNLTHTVAVTQNFCSPRNFDQVWEKTRTGRKLMAWKWLMKLEEKYPNLADRAKEMNANDNFVMKYDPNEIARREREEKRRKEARKKRKERRKSSAPTSSSSSYQHSEPGTSWVRNSSKSKSGRDEKAPRQTNVGEESQSNNKRTRLEHPTVSP